MEPIIGILLRNGVTHKDLALICKQLYVQVATDEFGIRGRDTNLSRVAMLTGIDRKEVARIKEAMQSNTQKTLDAKVLWDNVQQRVQSVAPLQFFAPFLTNHDQERIAYQLQQHDAKAKLAAAMLFSSPGTPYIYYGEEIGLTQGGTGHDVYKRAPMLWDNTAQAGFSQSSDSWVEQLELFGANFPNWYPDFLSQQLQAADRSVAAQQAQPDSIWQLYKLLIAQKKQRPELSTEGSYDVKQLDNGLVQISRELNGSKTLFVLNLSDSAQDISAINRDALTASWAFDVDGSSLAAHGLLMLQSKE